MPGPKYVKEFEFPKSAGFHDHKEVRFLARGGRPKIAKVMGEFADGELHSGSKTGPVVTNPKQARAIAMSEAGMSRPNFKARATRPGGMKKGGALTRGYPVDSGKPLVGKK